MGSQTAADLVVKVDSVAVGGAGVGRDESGRVVFVDGGLPGEEVRVRVEKEHARHAQGTAVDIVTAGPARIAPVCPHVVRGCGGCGWAHVEAGAQRSFKEDVVAQALRRIGRLPDAVVRSADPLPDGGHRTTVRAAVVGGRAAFRRAHGHDRVVVDSCRVSHPLVEEVVVDGRFGDADEVVIRAGVATGERLVVVSPSVPDDIAVPSGVVVVGADELTAGHRAWIHEEVAGVRFRVSAESFFQTRPDGAEALVHEVGRALDDAPTDATLVDLYCGVGLFAATVGRGRRVVAVERSRSSVADAKVNVSEGAVKVIRSAVEKWRPSPAGVVVADPARHGLAKEGVAKVDATGAHHLALVSCDAGALGRDAGLLVAAGWRHEWSTVVDMFPDTPHVEVVSRFVR
jgi:23S rRNA (uracil1939-C5)-methyltransferase